MVSAEQGTFEYKGKNLMVELATLEQCKAASAENKTYSEIEFEEWIEVTYEADGLDWYVEYTPQGELLLINIQIHID